MVQHKDVPSSEAIQPTVIAMWPCMAFKYSLSLSVLICQVGMTLPAIPGGCENQMVRLGTQPDTPQERLSVAFHLLSFQMEETG